MAAYAEGRGFPATLLQPLVFFKGDLTMFEYIWEACVNEFHGRMEGNATKRLPLQRIFHERNFVTSLVFSLKLQANPI